MNTNNMKFGKKNKRLLHRVALLTLPISSLLCDLLRRMVSMTFVSMAGIRSFTVGYAKSLK